MDKGDSIHDQKENSAADQLNKIYNLLPTIDGLLPVVYSILSRLKSLATLHADAEHVIQGFNEFEDTLVGLKFDMESWQKSLEHLEEHIEQFRMDMLQNGQSIEKLVKYGESR